MYAWLTHGADLRIVFWERRLEHMIGYLDY